MSFTPRTSKTSPTDMTWQGSVTDTNKWWYSNDYNAGATGRVCLPNCTTYAMGRSGEIANKSVRNYEIMNRTGFPDATDWFDNARWETGQTPKLGAIACWSDTHSPTDKNYWGGHVAIVEETDGTLSGTKLSMSGYVAASSGTRSFTNPGTSASWYFQYHTFEQTNYWYTTYNDRQGVFKGFIYNPYVSGGGGGGSDVLTFTNNDSYAYCEWDGASSESGYDYKLQLVAPYLALAGNPNNVTDDSMSGWDLIARINGSFFFSEGTSSFADGLEKQHWTWNEQYDDTQFDNVLAIGGDGSNNTQLQSDLQGNMREYSGEWCLTGGISLAGGSYVSSAVNTSTGHSFIGYNGTKCIMGVCKPGVAGATMRSYISSKGYTGVELDGGGSTCMNYLGKDYSNKYDGRSVKNVICLYRRAKETPKYNVSLTVDPDGSGVVSGGGTYDKGSNVIISATPNKHYKFIKWSDGNTDMTRTIENITSDITLTAYFEKSNGIIIKGSLGIDFQIL